MEITNKIKSEEISVIVQGPIHKKRTKKALQSIRKNLPNAEIILSTWENSNVDGLEYDILIFNKDPGTELQKKFKTKALYNNINRMILSTNNELDYATKKYTLKLRSDCCIDDLRFLSAFEQFPKRCEEYKLFERRILASTLFSRIAIYSYKQAIELPFHLSDWWFFGLTEDIKKFLLSSELVNKPYFSNYFEYPENKNKTSVYEKFDWKFSPEQYIGYSCFSKYFDDIILEDCSNVSDVINKKSQICLANNFIFLEYKQSGIRNLKYPCSKNELLSGNQYLYSFYRFEQEYKKYCDSDYQITTHSKLFDNGDLGYSLLRVYKHIATFTNNEIPIFQRLEQLFLGIPISSIGYFIAVIKNLIRSKY